MSQEKLRSYHQKHKQRLILFLQFLLSYHMTSGYEEVRRLVHIQQSHINLTDILSHLLPTAIVQVEGCSLVPVGELKILVTFTLTMAGLSRSDGNKSRDCHQLGWSHSLTYVPVAGVGGDNNDERTDGPDDNGVYNYISPED